jgi:hypothetical protein
MDLLGPSELLRAPTRRAGRLLIVPIRGGQVSVRAGASRPDPARAALATLQSRLLDEGRWGDADLVGWLIDDLDRLPPPWGRVVRVLLSGVQNPGTGVG